MSTDPQTWTIGRVLDWTRRDFAERAMASPRLDAEVLVAHALGLRRIDLYTRHDQPLKPEELATIRGFVERRRKHEPVAYIVGHREFYGRTFVVDRNVLVPRPETEGVVGAVLDRLPPQKEGTSLHVADIGTGSGAIAITLALERSDVLVDAVDRSEDALRVARTNAERLGCSERIRFRLGDLYEPLPPETRYVAMASNPPYIRTGELAALPPDVRDHEPRLALDGGPEGDTVLAPLIAGARSHLEPGGTLVVELGHDQSPRARELARRAGFDDVFVDKDLAGIDRVLIAR